MGILLATGLLMLRKASPRARYVLSTGAMLVMALCPPITALWLSTAASHAHPAASASTSAQHLPAVPLFETMVGLDPQGTPEQSSLSNPESILPSLVAAWLVGVLLLSMRIPAAFAGTKRLTRNLAAGPAAVLLHTVETLQARFEIKCRVRLLISLSAEVPFTMGVVRPLIILPVSALTGLSPQQLELIIAHELAHIRRHDYLVNFCQIVIETVLFYHPAVWYASRSMRNEREHCCDDLALAACRSEGRELAQALTRIELLRASGASPAMAANGGDLLGRVTRLLRSHASKTACCSHLTLSVLVTFILVAVTVLIAQPSDSGSSATEEHISPSTPENASDAVDAMDTSTPLVTMPGAGAFAVFAAATGSSGKVHTTSGDAVSITTDSKGRPLVNVRGRARLDSGDVSPREEIKFETSGSSTNLTLSAKDGSKIVMQDPVLSGTLTPASLTQPNSFTTHPTGSITYEFDASTGAISGITAVKGVQLITSGGMVKSDRVLIIPSAVANTSSTTQGLRQELNQLRQQLESLNASVSTTIRPPPAGSDPAYQSTGSSRVTSGKKMEIRTASGPTVYATNAVLTGTLGKALGNNQFELTTEADGSLVYNFDENQEVRSIDASKGVVLKTPTGTMHATSITLVPSPQNTRVFRNPPQGNYLTASTLPTKAEATAVLNSLKQNGYGPLSLVENKSLFNVVLGPFESIKESGEVADRLIKEGYKPRTSPDLLESTPGEAALLRQNDAATSSSYIRMGTFPSQNEADSLVKAMRGDGYADAKAFKTVYEKQGTVFTVDLGPFHSEAETKTAMDDLKRNGYQPAGSIRR